MIIPVTGEDRRFIHTFGANAALCAADLAPALATAPDVLYIGGFLVLPALRQDELAAQLRLARQAGTRVVFDVVAPAGRALSLDDVAGVLPEVDYFVPNDDEAAALTGERDPRRQAERLLELGAGTVVVTLGERGLIAASRDDTFELPAPHVDFVESSGAGDAFAAGLVYGLLQSWPLAPLARVRQRDRRLGVHAPRLHRRASSPAPRPTPSSRATRRAPRPADDACSPDARAHGYALGYFEAWDGYSLEAVVEAAEAERAPVIIGTGCLLGHQPWFDAGGIELLGALGGELARRARVPVALLLNETHTLEQSLRGLDAGFNAVMLHTESVAAVTRARGRSACARRCRRGRARQPARRSARSGRPLGGEPHRPRAGGRLRRGDRRRLPRRLRRERPPARTRERDDRPRPAARRARARAGPARHPRRHRLPARRDRARDRRRRGEVQRRHRADERAYLRGLTEALAQLPDEPDVHAAIGSHGPADVLEAGKAALVETVRDLIRQYGGSGRAA